jgi:YbbR domain-containing protein
MRLLESLPLKLVSLGLAALLWYVIAGEKTSEVGVTAPVELQNFPKDLELTGEAVNQVDVRLRGSPGMIQRIGAGDVSAQVDLRGVGEGEHIVHLTQESIRMPFGVTVVKVMPAELTLRLERTLQKVVPIRPRLLGEPAPGHEVGEVVAEPAEVRIAGPESRVLDVESAYTEPVSVEGSTADVRRQVTVGLEDPLLRIQADPRARVTVRVRERAARRTFERPVVVRGAGRRTRPATVQVVLAGPASALAAVAEEEVKVWVDAPAGEGEATVTVALDPARPAVRVQETQPASVRVYNRR